MKDKLSIVNKSQTFVQKVKPLKCAFFRLRRLHSAGLICASK